MTKSRGIYEMHGGKHTKAYGIWLQLRGRCNNPKNRAYPNYGGRGIKVCERWSKFSNFLADMGQPPPSMTLERKNNDEGYSKENCIWADRTAQSRNKRGNRLVTLHGETLPLSAWVERMGLKYGTIHQRILNGWPPQDALTVPLVVRRPSVKPEKGSRLYSKSSSVTFRFDPMSIEFIDDESAPI